MAYAQGTTVSAEKSRAEIEQTLARYGAGEFGYMTDANRSVVIFKCKGRAIRIIINKADPSKFRRARGTPTPAQKGAYVEQEARRRWRALLLVIKAKLEAIASGIATFEDEFMPYTVMPNGQTVGEWAAPQLANMGEGKMLLALPAGVS